MDVTLHYEKGGRDVTPEVSEVAIIPEEGRIDIHTTLGSGRTIRKQMDQFAQITLFDRDVQD